jgi:hypothetical protein
MQEEIFLIPPDFLQMLTATPDTTVTIQPQGVVPPVPSDCKGCIFHNVTNVVNSILLLFKQVFGLFGQCIGLCVACQIRNAVGDASRAVSSFSPFRWLDHMTRRTYGI